MPRPNPPPPAQARSVTPFSLESAEKRALARALGLSELSPAIADAISAYKATETGSPDTTVGNTLAALAELKKKVASTKKPWPGSPMTAPGSITRRSASCNRLQRRFLRESRTRKRRWPAPLQRGLRSCANISA